MIVVGRFLALCKMAGGKEAGRPGRRLLPGGASQRMEGQWY